MYLFKLWFSLDMCPEVGLQDHIVALFLVFKGTATLFSLVIVLTYIPTKSEELKSLLMKVKESEKFGLKVNIQKTKIMAFCPITLWEIDGETVETVADFIFGGFKITADGDYSHEIKRGLLLGRKAMTNLDSKAETLLCRLRSV